MLARNNQTQLRSPNQIEPVRIEDLPDLAFELILSYLDLKQVLRAKAVSKKFYWKINNFRVKSLCFFHWRDGYNYYGRNRYGHQSMNLCIEDNCRLMDGKFAQNTINTSRLSSFFANFGQSTLRNLRHLRIRDSKSWNPLELVEVVNSLKSLESLHLVQSNLDTHFTLILPELKSIRLGDASGFQRGTNSKLTLDAPKLSKVWARNWYQLKILHTKSVETLVIFSDRFIDPTLENFKNLKLLSCDEFNQISDTLLPSLVQLKEIHLMGYDEERQHVRQLVDQKQTYDRYELKIYYRGLLCLGNSNSDPEWWPYKLSEEALSFLNANYSRLAEQVPFFDQIKYSTIQCTIPLMPVDFWPRLIDLNSIELTGRVRKVARFLNFSKNCPFIRKLVFKRSRQSRNLMDSLPDHCPNLQHLFFVSPSNVESAAQYMFLFKCKQLTTLTVNQSNTHFNGLITRMFNEINLIQYLWFDFDEGAMIKDATMSCCIEFFVNRCRPFYLRITGELVLYYETIEEVAQRIEKHKMPKMPKSKKLKTY